MRANHVNLAESARVARVGITNDSMCKCNESPETLNHVLQQCKLYNVQRSILIERLIRAKMRLALSVDVLIAKPHILACSYMLAFFENCNLSI